MRKRNRIFYLWTPLLVLFAGCASRPIISEIPGRKNLRQWTGKAQLFDRQKDRKHTVDMDVLAEGEKRLRLDVAGSFAVALAAAVVHDDQLICVLPRQKRYYKGPATAEALSAALQVPLDPQILYAILHDDRPASSDWLCEMNAQQLPEKCENKKTGQDLVWSQRNDLRKKVLFRDPRFEIDLSLTEVQTKVQDLDRAFTLTVPPEYKPIQR